MPDNSKPVINPMEPSPDKPVQTKPNQDQPQQNTIFTEDKENIFLWGVLGIMSISIVIISTKKKNRLKNK